MPHVPSRVLDLSIQTSQIPDDWCRVIITLVAKASHKADSNLLVPIRLTAVVCKELPAILKGKMFAQLSQRSLLTSRQHGDLTSTDFI